MNRQIHQSNHQTTNPTQQSRQISMSQVCRNKSQDRTCESSRMAESSELRFSQFKQQTLQRIHEVIVHQNRVLDALDESVDESTQVRAKLPKFWTRFHDGIVVILLQIHESQCGISPWSKKKPKRTTQSSIKSINRSTSRIITGINV